MLATILDTIVRQKQIEIEEGLAKIPLPVLKEQANEAAAQMDAGRSLRAALHRPGEIRLLAEIKKASPSKGLIREDFDPAEIARTYTTFGAAAISVLTDEKFFQGSPEYLREVRQVTDLPLLRKDFIIDPYQIYEAKVLGADAILLIMAILEPAQLAYYLGIAEELGLECLVEVHSAEELVIALEAGAKVIGINNRDLKSFKTDLETTFRLRAAIADPEITIVSESGINTREDIQRLQEAGINGVLIGEALMRASDIGSQIQILLGDPSGKVPEGVID